MIFDDEWYSDRWEQSNIPIKLRGLRLKDFEPVHHSGKIAALEAQDFIDDFRNRYVSEKRAKNGDIPENRHVIGKGLMFYGRNGTRKSTLSAAIATEVQHLSPSFRVFYIRFSEWQRALTDTYNREPDERTTVAKRFLKLAELSHLVVLDDLGQEYRTASGFTKDKLHELTRVRYEAARPTIVTTNIEPTEMREIYGVSFDSFRHDAFDTFEMLGRDSRKNRN